MQELGFNYRLTDLQAALGISQLKKLDKFIERRRELADRYDLAWKDHPVVQPAQSGTSKQSALHLYVVRIPFGRIGTTRQAFMKLLREKGIVAQVHYIPVHFHPYYAPDGDRKGEFPHAENYYEETLSLPLYFGLSDDEQNLVIQSINDLVK